MTLTTATTIMMTISGEDISVVGDRLVTRGRMDSHNSMTHNDSQNALRKCRCDCRVDITVTRIRNIHEYMSMYVR